MTSFGWSLPPGCDALPDEQYADPIDLKPYLPDSLRVIEAWFFDDNAIRVHYAPIGSTTRTLRFDHEWIDTADQDGNIAIAAAAIAWRIEQDGPEYGNEFMDLGERAIVNAARLAWRSMPDCTWEGALRIARRNAAHRIGMTQP